MGSLQESPRLSAGVHWINKVSPLAPTNYAKDGSRSCMEQKEGVIFRKLCYTNALRGFWWGETIYYPLEEPLPPLEAFTSVNILPAIEDWTYLLRPAPPAPCSPKALYT
ncbi:hypothetical protein DSO57_1004770 [Entomophthora muscae]|uniref:Uncharacterized protein n=1 Tax=Entomophthora muscae TaxID=34485 RepID=A0ACC2UTU8_9FUNG|nr:hypothetical protein DSO57_1004770 [Entomophthora muscae]